MESADDDYGCEVPRKNVLGRKEVCDKRFKNNLPGQDWLNGFTKRHVLVQRCDDNVKPVRAKITAQAISAYFENLKDSLQGVPPCNVHNYDETNFTDDPGVSKVVCRRGPGRVERKVMHSKTSISVMFCGNGSGEFLPPMVVYKAKNVYTEWTTGGPVGAVFDASPSRWFDSRTFTRWFRRFLKNTSAQAANSPRLIIGDNLASHFEPTVLAIDAKSMTLYLCHCCQMPHTCYSRWTCLSFAWQRCIGSRSCETGRRRGDRARLTPNTFPLVDADLFILFRDSFDDEQPQEIIFLLDFLTVLDGAV